MEHIIVNFQPFLKDQHIMVYKKGVCIEQAFVSYDNVIDSVCLLSNKHNITNIDLCGNTDFLKEIKNQLKLNTNFNSNSLNISIINK